MNENVGHLDRWSAASLASNILFPRIKEAPHKIWRQVAQCFRGEVVF